MDQNTWEIVEVLFPHRAEALRGAMEALEKAVQIAAHPPTIGDFWKGTKEPGKKGAGDGVDTTSHSDENPTIVGHNSYPQVMISCVGSGVKTFKEKKGPVCMATGKERSAFCATCPSPETVTRLLTTFGLTLTYTRPAEGAQEYLHLPPLPAQYHFEDDWGTQVQFLAGPDTPRLADDGDDEDDKDDLPAGCAIYPPHASRFWLIPGANPLSTRRVQEALAAQVGFRWNEPETTTVVEHAA